MRSLKQRLLSKSPSIIDRGMGGRGSSARQEFLCVRSTTPPRAQVEIVLRKKYEDAAVATCARESFLRQSFT